MTFDSVPHTMLHEKLKCLSVDIPVYSVAIIDNL